MAGEVEKDKKNKETSGLNDINPYFSKPFRNKKGPSVETD
jgi:hypothetical protein